jgi:DNA-binding MarR family transcriptional regulator
MMAKITPKLTERDEIRLLAKFRSEIRRFLRFSENAAVAAGLEPQQHQLLLQIAGVPDGTLATISHVADSMSIQHHTAVELSKRCERAGLLRKVHDLDDRRCVILELTAKGQRALRRLSDVHARQLRELAPSLIQALTRISDSKISDSKIRADTPVTTSSNKGEFA